MQMITRYRTPAFLCALAVLLCELLAHPIADMGMIDDTTYVPMAHTLAVTGHIAYNGWGAGMLGWQLYLAAAFIKLFGFSFTVVRSSTIFVAIGLAFLLQRTLARAGLTERNATIGTLTLVLCPMYLLLSATFMSDITGLFGMVICLYGCLRALQAPTDRTTIAWLFFAVLTNAVFGTSRQIAWLGILVMVPSTLWLLRDRLRVVLAGAVTTLAGVLFIFACLRWLKHQPYIVPEHLTLFPFSPVHFFSELVYFSLDAPFFLLPILALFLPGLRRTPRKLLIPLSILLAGYLFLGVYPSHIRGHFPLEPIGECFNGIAMFAYPILEGTPPDFLPLSLRALCMLLAVAGVLGLFTLLRESTAKPMTPPIPLAPTWQQLRVLLVPFSIAYAFLICQRGVIFDIHDRYLLGLLVLAIVCLLRYDQDLAPARFPLISVFLIAIIAIYSILANHQMFAFYRARVAIAAELLAAGVPATSIHNGWEYDYGVELQHANHINTPSLEFPRGAYVPTPTPAPSACSMPAADQTPHIHPLYAISFDPTACYGLAPFAPVQYSRWPYQTPGTLYVVRFTPAANP
jgi:hypothetical protein